jgi:hypothetical protein
MNTSEEIREAVENNKDSLMQLAKTLSENLTTISESQKKAEERVL